MFSDHFGKIVGLFLVAAHVGIARHAKRMHALDLHSAKQLTDVVRNDLLHRHEVHGRVERLPPPAVARHLDTGEVLGAAGRMAQDDGQRQAQVGDERKRAPRVYGQRREHREDIGLEVLVERGLLIGVEGVVVVYAHAGAGLERGG